MNTNAPVGYFAAAYQAPSGFSGGNIAYASLYEAAQAMAAYSTSSLPTAGGTLTINGVPLGSYDFCVKQGNQTISAFTASDWFTTTQDTNSAFIVVNGSLTINSGITVIPTARKLFVVVHCTGTLTLNGTLSMSLRGANHSGLGSSGGSTAAAAIRIATGTYSGFTNPTIPATGGSGGAISTAIFSRNNGGAAPTFGTGGGGSGDHRLTFGATSPAGTNCYGGAGAAGTAFCGGSGGGGCGYYPPASNLIGGNGVANGGSGGAAAGSAVGGVGNPTANASNIVTGSTDQGCGGTLVVIATTYAGAGSIESKGGSQSTQAIYVLQNPGVEASGGGSGGGSVTVLAKTFSNTPTLNVAGGTTSGQSGAPSGGYGGSGSANQLVIP